MVQMRAGLITYILFAIYCHCHSEFGGKVSIQRVRELWIKIKNETLAIEEMCKYGCNQQHQY